MNLKLALSMLLMLALPQVSNAAIFPYVCDTVTQTNNVWSQVKRPYKTFEVRYLSEENAIVKVIATEYRLVVYDAGDNWELKHRKSNPITLIIPKEVDPDTLTGPGMYINDNGIKFELVCRKDVEAGR